MINDKDVEKYDAVELRKHIAVLFQEKCEMPVLMELTLQHSWTASPFVRMSASGKSTVFKMRKHYWKPFQRAG